jgi:fructose-bisphosphate aldolase, class I
MTLSLAKGARVGLGKTVRLNRLFAHPSGRYCCIAVDHFIGYQDGLPAGLRSLRQTIAEIVAGAPDAITMHKGPALSCWPPFAGRIPLIMQSVLMRPDDSANDFSATPEDAVRLGADAFATGAYVRGASEATYLRRVADFVRQAEHWEMPVILHIYPRVFSPDGKAAISFEPEHIAWAVRCGIEIGVDVIKTPYCGNQEAYAQIVRDCPVPLVAAGGPQANKLEDALALASAVVASGARGLTVGRNVWGFGHTTAAVRMFNAVIHDGASVAEALRIER